MGGHAIPPSQRPHSGTGRLDLPPSAPDIPIACSAFAWLDGYGKNVRPTPSTPFGIGPMKKHHPSELSSEVWQQIEFIFWRHRLSCLPSGFTGDGVEPISIETTKRGIEIEGRIWFLPQGCYDLHLCLARPHFTNISSVTAERVTEAIVSEAWLDRKTLRVTAGVPGAADVSGQATMAIAQRS